MEFEDLIALDRKQNQDQKVPTVPYTDEIEEGAFLNVYSNIMFNNINKFFVPWQPNGGSSDNCLAYSKGFYDVPCSFSQRGLCKIPKSKPYLILRGLCSQSQVERLYTAGSSNGYFIWYGNKHSKIMYTGHWLL